MLLRPEVLGVLGLCIAGLASLGIWLRITQSGSTRPSVCPHCGSMQHNLSRTAALAHEIAGPANCIACGQKLPRIRH
jgi:hypothetical protein